MKLFLIILFIVLASLSCDNSTNPLPGPLSLNLEPTHVSKFGRSDGSINLTVTGGTKPYLYQWSNNETTEDISNLTEGTYSVIVRDANAETITDSTVINQPPNPLLDRVYYSYVPPSYTRSKSVPLVIVLHHYGSNGELFESYSGFSSVADTAGFIVVYPNATGSPSEWNAGVGLTPSTLTVDDVEFISALIDKFTTDYSIDTSRICVAGFSNGSIMTNLLAAELSSKITAIGAVAGQASSAVMNNLNPTMPVAIIQFHMLDDLSIPYYGGSINGVSFPPVEDVINEWVSINNCLSQPTIIYDDGEVFGRQWTSNDQGADIALYRIATGGHTWPKSPVSATELIWEFFKNNPR